MGEEKQIHVMFAGRVQGVGFRQTARVFAQELNLKGWIKNLPDGRVEMVAAGSQEKLERMVQMLEEQFEGFILKKNASWEKAAGKFSDFRIVY